MSLYKKKHFTCYLHTYYINKITCYINIYSQVQLTPKYIDIDIGIRKCRFEFLFFKIHSINKFL